MAEVCKKHCGDGWYDSTKDCYICELEAEVAAWREAVSALPVEEWVQVDGNGEPELVGYVMQAQGEWDAVKALLEGNDV